MKRVILLIFIVIASQDSSASDSNQIIELYKMIRIEERNVAFVSISENYDLSDHKDSIAIPDLEGSSYEEIRHFNLNKVYRERFFERTHFSEFDKLFIYDFVNEKLLSFKLMDLKIAAVLSIYVTEGEHPFTQNDFHIGFEIKLDKLQELSDELYGNTYVYIGKKSPFIIGELERIKWDEIKPKLYPNEKIKYEHQNIWDYGEYKTGKHYSYQTTEYKYYLQELVTDDRVIAKHLIVEYLENEKTVHQKTFFESEGSMFKPQTKQWIGNLIKGYPPVCFGFMNWSFGCEPIYVIGDSNKEVRVLCDNRH